MLWSEAQRTVRSLVPFDGTLRFKMLIACWLPIFTGKQHDNDTYHARMGKVLMYNEKMAGEQDGLNSTCYPEKVNIRRRWSALSSHCSLPTLVRRIETSFQDPPDPVDPYVRGAKRCHGMSSAHLEDHACTVQRDQPVPNAAMRQDCGPWRGANKHPSTLHAIWEPWPKGEWASSCSPCVYFTMSSPWHIQESLGIAKHRCVSLAIAGFHLQERSNKKTLSNLKKYETFVG